MILHPNTHVCFTLPSDAPGSNVYDNLEYLDENGSFQVGPFLLPNPVFNHCLEKLSEREVLIYGGKLTYDVYVLDFANNGFVTAKAQLLPLANYSMKMACGSFVKDGDKFVIYAGGQDDM